jgi:hypothetical protein
MVCLLSAAAALALAMNAKATGAAEEASALGVALRQDGYTVRPPQKFRMARMDIFHGTRAGAVASSPTEARWLSAALQNGQNDDASTMMISVVEGSFHVTPAARDEFSTAVVRHFSEELSLRFSMEKAELVAGPASRIEVLGSVRQEGQVRHVLVSAMAGEGRHAAITFSVPSGQWESLYPAIRASLDSFRNEPGASREMTRSVAGAVASGVALALMVSLYFWRKRRLRQEE